MITSPAERKAATVACATWADVSLGALRRNFRAVQQRVGAAVNVCVVVKADAYGHGAVPCARALQSEGAQWFAVDCREDAVPLQDAGITGNILLLAGFWRGEEEEILRRGLRPMVWNLEQIELLERAAARMGVRHPIHLKIDTGMGRLGATLEELPQLCSALQAATHLKLEAVATHFASADRLGRGSVDEQLRRFAQARTILQAKGLNPPLVHAANTSAMLSRSETWFSMIRIGLAIYGYHLPFEGTVSESADTLPQLEPVLSWKTRILTIRSLPAGQALGYGGTYVTAAPARIAVLPVGYALGLNRQLSSRGRVIVRGRYAPIVGRVSMDLTLIDVTNIPEAAVEDEVILLGPGQGLCIDAQEHATIANTISYEILCGISPRVPRRYQEQYPGAGSQESVNTSR